MTINEQLQFSVLSAPVAALDRRTLSQAWYSALYGSGGGASAVKTAQPVPCARSASAAPVAPDAARCKRGTPEACPGARLSAAKTPASPQERRAPRSALARKIERVFLRPRSPSRKASFTLESEHGRVHVILRSSGVQLKLVAVCSPKARPHVAAALAQARYALAVRGIDLDASTRSRTEC